MNDIKLLVEETKIAIRQTAAAMEAARARIENLEAANKLLIDKLSGLLVYTQEVIDRCKEDT